MSETQENQPKMKNFTINCDNEIINCHAEIPSDYCIFLWIGQDSTATMAYGLLKHKSVIYGSPTPICAMQINEFASRIAKLFNERQVRKFFLCWLLIAGLIQLNIVCDWKKRAS